MRPSPRLVAAAKHAPLLILLFVGSVWIVVTGIASVARGQLSEGWLRIGLALVLAVVLFFVLRRALRDYG